MSGPKMASMQWRRALAFGVAAIAGAMLLFIAAALWQSVAEAEHGAADPSADAAVIERGRYLALIGNCHGCHTTLGGAQFAGGRGIPTPFGSIYTSNLTPDVATGIGAWSSQAFWRAMHNGRSRDGSLLYPAFPYPNTSLLRRSDSDAIYAFLHSLAPVRQPNRPHALRFPYNTSFAIGSWRLLFFRAATVMPEAPSSIAEPAESALWRRGAYLVNGLGHCSACHGQRNAFGGSNDALRPDGGLLPGEAWYAPSLLDNRQAGVGDWSVQQVIDLLTTGHSVRGSVQGPMAEVVFSSSQHLLPADAAAMAVYLRSIATTRNAPPASPTASAASDPDAAANGVTISLRRQGEDLYGEHCAACHGDRGEGVAGAYPALAGNRAVLLDPAVNLVQVIVHGGFGPATDGNPRPFGMPPFGITLSQAEIAALATFLRGAWGNQATPVSPRDVQRWLDASSR